MGDGLDVDLHHREEHGQARGKSLAHARLPPNGRTADARTIYLLPARVVSPTTRILPFMSRQPTVLVVTRTMCITEPTKSNYYVFIRVFLHYVPFLPDRRFLNEILIHAKIAHNIVGTCYPQTTMGRPTDHTMHRKSLNGSIIQSPFSCSRGEKEAADAGRITSMKGVHESAIFPFPIVLDECCVQTEGQAICA